MKPNELVKNWFGDEFRHLHPLLQQLHIKGCKLAGAVDFSYGKGLAGIIGARLAKKMNLPDKDIHQHVVSICHDEEGLHWGRRFNGQSLVESLFKPFGNFLITAQVPSYALKLGCRMSILIVKPPMPLCVLVMVIGQI